MEVKQAMEVLRKIAKKAKIEDSETRVAIFEGLKALEKQIPKKVKEVDEDFAYYFVCLNCNAAIWFSDDKETHKYCLNCGQKLDWSNENEKEQSNYMADILKKYGRNR